ncbi:hypothetical protein BH11MYX2_BH11MYX2_28920 [soil metagenome]
MYGPRVSRLLWLLLLAPLAACGDGARLADAGVDAVDLPAWDPTLPEASVMGARRGLTPARGIVHLHSPYSHDACDNHPRPGGVPDEMCLGDLRAALCKTRIDFADLTDHDASMADEEFTTLFSMRGNDTAIMRDGMQIASQIHCEDGHTVQVTIGGENDIMPIMLDHHPEAESVQARHDIYNGNDAATAAAFRTAGGMVWLAHTEDKDLDKIRELQPDGIEIYNLHANIDPSIRTTYLGLDGASAIAGAVEFADTQPGHPEPDLAMLAFLSPNMPAITKWQTLLGEGRHIAVTSGSDAHQNALPITMADGERGDSYRRVLRWFSNIALVANPHDIGQVKAALEAGRNYSVFEVFGTPDDFDAYITASGTTYEIGGVIPTAMAADAEMAVSVPTIRGLDASLPAPEITALVIHIAPGGTVTTLKTIPAPTTAPVHVNLAGAGAYRVEVRITPHHLGPYLHDLGTKLADAEYPWIYTSAFYIE